MDPVQELAEVFQRPVRECSKAFQNYAVSLAQPMQELAAAFGFPPRRSSPTIIARREPTFRDALAELDSIPEGEQLAFISEVHQALPPSVQERFLQEAIAQYVRNNRGHISTLGGGLLVVGVVEQHQHYHYHAPQGRSPGGAAPVSEMPPIPGQNRPEGDELLTEREREVARLLAQGKSQSEIAKELVISGGTVRSHKQRLAEKWQTGTSGHKALQIEAERRGYA